MESLHDGLDLHGTINRSMFDLVTGPLTRSGLGVVQAGLDESGLTPADISEVLLVGGGTAMLSVQSLLEAFFPDSKVRRDIAPEESVACGAAFEGPCHHHHHHHLARSLFFFDHFFETTMLLSLSLSLFLSSFPPDGRIQLDSGPV